MKGGVDMVSKVFAAIDVGSNELSMKVYEIGRSITSTAQLSSEVIPTTVAG